MKERKKYGLKAARRAPQFSNVNHTFRDVQFQKDFTNLSGNAPWEVYIFEKL